MKSPKICAPDNMKFYFQQCMLINENIKKFKIIVSFLKNFIDYFLLVRYWQMQLYLNCALTTSFNVSIKFLLSNKHIYSYHCTLIIYQHEIE